MSEVEKLRTALGVEKQLVNELEKALREMRSEHAEMKFTANSKLEEAHALFTSIEGNLCNQREDLREWERKLHEGEEKLAEVRRLLNQREELVNDSDRVFKQKQLDLEEAQKRIDVANLELKSKEDDISMRIENLILKEKEAAVISNNLQVREKELLELEEKLNAREQGDLHMKNITVRDLKAIARERKIPGYSNHRKLELAEMILIDLVADINVNRTSKSKPKKQHEMMQTTTTTNWFDLPLNLQVNILGRVGAIGKLWNVQVVCRDWSEICKDPSMWRVIFMDSGLCYDRPPCPWHSFSPLSYEVTCRKMCKNAVYRSRGQLSDITMVGFCDDEFLQFVADRSPKLRRLEIAYPDFSVGNLSKALKKLPNLEELKIYHADILQLDQEWGSYCPKLTTLGLNACSNAFGDEEMIAISENLRELRHLEIHMNHRLSNIGVQAILDGCPSLEVLDLRLCLSVDLKGVSGERLKEIECVLHTQPLNWDPYSNIPDFKDLKTWRKIILEGNISARMSDSDSD